MNTSTEHILQCNQSEQLADASGRVVDLMNENACGQAGDYIRQGCFFKSTHSCNIY